jgi:hypothetical protein
MASFTAENLADGADAVLLQGDAGELIESIR